MTIDIPLTEKTRPSTCRCADPASERRDLAAELNRHCACITLDRGALYEALRKEIGDDAFVDDLVAARPHLVSNVAAFVSHEDAMAMQRVVSAVEAAARLPGFQEAALTSDVARADFGPAGAFMGYDFHITPAGPKLIEINTNAGGAYLNALIARAQLACCAEVEQAFAATSAGDFSAQITAMFEAEWRRQRGSGRPRRIAIVDDAPREQYLYPELVLARRLFEEQGLSAIIADARELDYRGGVLYADGIAIDLVYNRVTDFAFDEPQHAALRAAYLDGAVVVTPNPRHHALFADKRNLVRLSDAPLLAGWGLSEDHLDALKAVPHAIDVTPENAEALWTVRKKYFFKPFAGYGSKAVYRGDKVTKRTWAEIIKGGYIAQSFAAPGERTVSVDDEERALKADIRLFTYDGRLLLAAARLYQGQTTNFRTTGGGFAPVFLS